MKKIIRVKISLFFLLGAVIIGCQPRYEIPPPIIKYISPESGKVGSQITVSGSSLDGATEASINGTKAQILNKPTSKQLIISVPIGATSGKIKVFKGEVFGVSITDFEVFPPPSIDNIYPVNGKVGTEVTIIGRNFGPNLDLLIVSFNGVNAKITERSNSLIKVLVPKAASGMITILAQGGTVISTTNFMVD